MSASFLVDKSAWARATVPLIADVLRRLSGGGLLATCSITDLEVLFSARGAAEHAALRTELDGLERVDIDQAAFDRAIEVQGDLARSGRHRLPIPDLVIAAVAELNGLTVLHYDRDFETIADVTGQPQQWVVERGSV